MGEREVERRGREREIEREREKEGEDERVRAEERLRKYEYGGVLFYCGPEYCGSLSSSPSLPLQIHP